MIGGEEAQFASSFGVYVTHHAAIDFDSQSICLDTSHTPFH